MTQTPDPTRLRVADLPTRRETRFDLAPPADACAALAREYDLIELRKLRFSGQLRALGKQDFRLEAQLGATVVQSCVVTLAPVTTRIDAPVERLFSADPPEPEDEGGESEMPEDDRVEALGEWIDLGAIMTEALSLAIPAYPRAEGAAMEVAQFAEPGTRPMTDDDAKPFAGLAGLKDKLSNDPE